MMSTTQPPETHDDVIRWLIEEAQRLRIAKDFRARVAREENGWLHVEVNLGNVKSISKRATLLQKMEDDWSERTPRPHWQLLLVSSAN